ncbi:MAG TPA: hypothetical protein VHD91_07380 [Gaiellaceae bacterium]|nr:hypothetical protein [Gaiellaceae bacterium]
MNTLEQASRLVATGDERRALQILHETVDATADPELLREIHALAENAHESSHGLHRIEWERLMLETEN